MMLAARKADPPINPAPSFFVDFTDPQNYDLTGHPHLFHGINPLYDPEPPYLYPAVRFDIPVAQPMSGNYFTIRYPSYGAEALEIEYFTQSTNGPIVSCGNGVDNFAAAQFRQNVITNVSLLKIFDTPTTTKELQIASGTITMPARKRLRVERRGTNITYKINTGSDYTVQDYVQSTNIVGTADPAVYNMQMAGPMYQTAVVFPNGTSQLIWLKWEALV